MPVSGGKDSQVVLSLALKTGAPIVCVHQNTGFDHPDTYAQLKNMEEFYGVTIEHTLSDGMLPFLKKAGYFPNSAARGCTQQLKQKPFAKWLIDKQFSADNSVIWFGMRSDESRDRTDKYGGLTEEDDFTLADVGKFYAQNKKLATSIGLIPVKLPIVSWNTEQVFEYIKNESSPLNPLYAKGHSRVGCYPCLLTRKAEWQIASKDSTGRQHIEALVALEDQWKAEGNPRKLIRVHKVWDVRDFLAGKDVRELANEECGYCSI